MGLDVAEIGMGADLSLDLRHFASKAVRQVRDAPASEMDAFIRQLEEEQSKIVAFRSELPLCVRIVAYAIGAMKEEKRKNGGEEEEEDGAAGDKSNWMSTAQLWTGGSDRDAAESEKQDKLQGRTNTLPAKSCGVGAFVPFKAVGSGAPAFGPPLYMRKDDKPQQPAPDAGVVPDLSLLTPPAIQRAAAAAAGVADESRRHHVVGFAQAAARAAAMAPAAVAPALSLQPQATQQQQQQQPRKSRRCWSTELHRQFVAALNQLGGPHAATPKQIRELMKVDGLTNDEVKSHLQKYRLHNRRTPGSAAVTVSQPIMVVGGLWIPHHQQEPASSSHQSGSPHGPLHFSAATATASGMIAASSSASGEEEDGSRADSYGWI